jgi:hypothetical protein
MVTRPEVEAFLSVLNTADLWLMVRTRSSLMNSVFRWLAGFITDIATKPHGPFVI